MDLLTKHVLGGINVVGSCEGDSMDEQCFQGCEEEANFINNQARGSRPNDQGPNQGSWRKGQGNQGWNKDSENQGWNKDSGNSHWRDNNQSGYNNNQGGYNNHRSSNPYVPPKGNQIISSQPSTSDPASPKMEDMLSRVLKKVESTNSFCKEIRDEMKSLGLIVGFHSTSIKQLESQLGQISATLNQRQKGTLPSDTVANPKNDGDHKCHAITTRSGKTIGGETWVKDNRVANDEKIVEEPIVDKEEVTPKKKRTSIEKPIIIEKVKMMKFQKKADDRKFLKFIERLKGLSINIPLVEALEQMPGYAKFIKDLVTKRRHASFEMVGVTHHCSSIVTKALVQKKKDPGAFTIPCTIGIYKFVEALCDLGASINLMLLAIFNKLCLGTPQPTIMRLLMADRTFIFLANFVILDCEVEVPIILGRPFLATGRALVDVERGNLKFRMNEEEITFHICKSMKQPADMTVVSVTDTIDKAIEIIVEHKHVGDMLAAVIMNNDGENEEEFGETLMY
ncbi:uncharacterized protein LOC132038513 [Lycium ferocissimum]|uniref:uncharacterized protein LOC132038513 n=1 Tax=Lycium ferocissimum TaxID=112874 RepID=UPI0028157C27|nr:uncharacterized protein LOC132038513 [Lycium ferocissimum]